MLQEKNSADKAGKGYWDSVWNESEIPDAIDPNQQHRSNTVNRRFDLLFREIFAPIQPKGKTLLEIGCAQSAWLPYFSREFGFQVSGLDYSEIGCEQERMVLDKANVHGDIICADMFAPPDSLRDSFDVVVSFGVLEHFQDTAKAAAAFAQFVRPGGIVVTIIPNIPGAVGYFTKLLNYPVYAIHVPLNRAALQTAHTAVGLDVQRCEYFLSTNFSVVNLNGLDTAKLSTRLKGIVLRSLARFSTLVWILEDRINFLPPNPVFAPYIICVAQKPQK